MGKVLSRLEPAYDIVVKTGDVKGGGTDANVYVTLIGENGESSREILLDEKWRNDFERGKIDLFRCRDIPVLGNVVKIELRRDSSGLKDDWFVEWIKVRSCRQSLNTNASDNKSKQGISTDNKGTEIKKNENIAKCSTDTETQSKENGANSYTENEIHREENGTETNTGKETRSEDDVTMLETGTEIQNDENITKQDTGKEIQGKENGINLNTGQEIQGKEDGINSNTGKEIQGKEDGINSNTGKEIQGKENGINSNTGKETQGKENGTTAYASTTTKRTKNGGKSNNNASLPRYTIFPCNRWIKANRKYVFTEYDSVLPQFDENQAQRVTELAEKRRAYQFKDDDSGLPRQVKSLPSEESFSDDYKWDLVRNKLKLLAQGKITKLTADKWRQLEDIKKIYRGPFEVPLGYNRWRSDEHFGRQRLQGCNASLIRRCDEIPPNLGIWEQMILPFLGGNSLKDVIAKKRLYIVDLKDLDGIKCKDERALCAPIALFYVRDDGNLVPICIQLFQQESDDNPVFLPSDPEYTWLMAKMYFNNADAAFHQSCAHLGFTHLVCESIAVAVHRNLSPSHPIYRLLMPHFIYLFAINNLALEKLVCPGGWIDNTMTMGRTGMFEILKGRYSTWRFSVDGWLPANLAERGVDDTEALPYYPLRDDALLTHNAIYTYVSEIVDLVYGEGDALTEDNEVQGFARCLTDKEEGCGFADVPGGGSFATKEELSQTLATIIYLGSVAHAATNFCQYDDYAFPPNYPAVLHGDPPKTKDPLSEKDIIDRLPDEKTTVDIMVVTKLLSERGTKSLGDFELQYLFGPKEVAAVRRFRKNLKQVSNTIKQRNKSRSYTYHYLDPAQVPNAISI